MKFPNVVYESDCILHGQVRTAIPVETDFWFDLCPLCNRELKMYPIGRSLRSFDLAFKDDDFTMSDKRRKNLRKKLHERIPVMSREDWEYFEGIAKNCG